MRQTIGSTARGSAACADLEVDAKKICYGVSGRVCVCQFGSTAMGSAARTDLEEDSKKMCSGLSRRVCATVWVHSHGFGCLCRPR